MTTDPNEAYTPANTASDWTRQVVDNLFEAEKSWIEMASQQNALVLRTMREVLALYRGAPNAAMGDWARQGLESFVEAQRKWVENITQQQASFLSDQRAEAERMQAAHSEAGVANPVSPTEQPVEYLAQARRRWLDFAAQQNAQFLKAVREGMGLSESATASTVTDWSQQAVDNYVEVQKRWLNLATQWSFPFTPPKDSRNI